MKSTGTFILFYFLLVVLIFSDQSLSQTFKLKNYTFSDGIPEQMIFDVVQDSSGLMWFATVRGIYSYDGNEWKLFDDSNNIPLVHYERIFLDSKGILWFVPFNLTYPIIYRERGAWHQLKTEIKDFMTATSVYVEYNNVGRTIYISTQGRGIIVHNGKKWNSYTTADGILDDMVYQIIGFKGEIFILTAGGLCYFAIDNRIKPTGVSDLVFAADIQKDKDNEELWFLGRNWIGKYEDHKIRYIYRGLHIPFASKAEYYFVKVEKRKKIFFGNRSASFIMDLHTNNITECNRKNGFITEGVTSIITDYEGNNWLTTLRGISKVTNSPFRNFYESDGLLENEVSAVQQFENGLIVLGYNLGLGFYNGKSFKNFSFSRNFDQRQKMPRILDVIKTSDGNLLAASNNNGLVEIKPDTRVKVYKHPEVSNYFSVLESSKKEIFVGTEAGLYRFTNGQLFPDKRNRDNLLRRLLESSDGSIVAATPYGLLILEESETRLIKAIVKEANNIFSLYQISKNEMLLGTLAGLFIFNGIEIRKYEDNGLSIDNPVYFIIKDHDNNIWFGLDIGVAKWNGSSLTYYGINEGLSGSETNRAAGFVDSEGKVWIGTNNGVSVYDKYYDDTNIKKPKIQIVSVNDNFNSKYDPKADLTLPYDRNNLIIHFRALTFIDETKTRYFIKISNLESDWKYEYTTTERFARFNNLPPGKYTFTLSARNVRGLESETIHSGLITINRPFYNQLWFYIAVVLVIGFIFYSFTDYFNQKKYAKSLESQVKKRTEQLETSEKHYRTLVETSTDGILVIKRDNTISFSNRHAPQILGFNVNTDLTGEDVFRFIPSHMQSEALSIREQLQKSSESLRFEFELVNRNGKVFPAEINMSTIRDYDTGEKLFITIFRDISYIKQVQWRLENLNIDLEKRVKDKTRELTALIDQSPLGIAIFNTNGNISEINENFSSVYLDFAHGGQLNKYNLFKDKFIYSEDNKLQIDGLLETGGNLMLASIRCTRFGSENKKQADEKIFEVRFYTINNSSGKIERIAVLIDDVTERSHLEEMNRKLSEQMMRSSIILDTLEKERKRISRDLHDDLGQLFTTAKLKIEIFQHKTKIKNEHLSDALKLLLDAGRTISDIVHNLHPVEIERYGLMPALELLCEKIRKHYRINVSIIKNGSIPDFDKARELSIYRIVQEALMNSVKHSGCTSIVLKVESENGSFRLISEDNGHGIKLDDKGMPETNGGHGIIGMIERVSLFNDELQFENLRSGGTRITLKINYVDYG